MLNRVTAFFSFAQLNPDQVAFILIGAVSALFGVVCFIFRGFAEVVEAYYDLKARWATARERFLRVSNDRANGTG